MDNKLTPQEIEAVNLMLRQASQVLLDQPAMEKLASDAKQGNPAQALADAVRPVLQQVYAAAQGAGKTLDMKVAALAGREMIKILVAVLGASGIIKAEQAAQLVDEAFKLGVAAHNKSVGYTEPAPQQGGGLLAQGA